MSEANNGNASAELAIAEKGEITAQQDANSIEPRSWRRVVVMAILAIVFVVALIVMAKGTNISDAGMDLLKMLATGLLVIGGGFVGLDTLLKGFKK